MRRRWGSLPALLLVVGPAGAIAHPSREGGEGLFEVRSAIAPVQGSWSVGVSGVRYRIDAERDPDGAGDRAVLDGGLLVAVGYGGWLEAHGRLAIDRFANDDGSALAFGDGLLGAKVALPWRTKWLHAGLAGRVRLPWGDRERGFSTGTYDPGIAALFTIPLPESNPRTSTRLHVNVGYRWRNDDRGRGYEGFPLYYLEPVYAAGDNDRIDLRGALEIESRRLTIFAELLLDYLPGAGVAWREGPVFLTPGVRYSLGESVSVLLGSKISLAIDDETSRRHRPPEEFLPDWQLVFALAWTSPGRSVDRDRDGVPDFRDRCPHVPEDPDGWQDSDGCPDPDNDGDGAPSTPGASPAPTPRPSPPGSSADSRSS